MDNRSTGNAKGRSLWKKQENDQCFESKPNSRGLKKALAACRWMERVDWIDTDERCDGNEVNVGHSNWRVLS